LDLYRNQHVLGLSIEPLKDDWLVMGEVQGSQRQPYEVTIEVTRGPAGQVLEWDSDCTCPVGYQCKHGVALMIKAAYKGAQLLGDSAPLTPAPPKKMSLEQVNAQIKALEDRVRDIARQEAQNQVLRWLKELERSNVARTEPRAQRSPQAQRQEQFLYLLGTQGPQGQSPQLTLEVMLSHPKVTGGWAKPKPMRFFPERGQPIYDLASETDLDLLQLMRAMPGSNISYYYSYNAKSKVTPDGKYGVEALQKAASTGRLFVAEANNALGQPVQWGPTQHISWVWNEVTQPPSGEDAWALRAQLEGGEGRICLNNPPLYLDATRGVCGLLDLQGMSAGQIAVLLKAPPMQAQVLKALQNDLVQQLGPVPLPPVVESLPILTDLEPRPCLHLKPSPPQDVAQQGLMQATLRFAYGEHQGWWVGQGRTVVVEGKSGRARLQRDPEAELEWMSLLLDLGFSNVRTGVFGVMGYGAQQTWLRWVDTDYAELRDAGFEVTTDDALQDWIRHVDTLEVNLQHQGEDEATSPWFDLSLGIEIDGVRHNILPMLPGLIATAADSPRDEASGLPVLPPYLYLPNPQGGFLRVPSNNLKPWLGALLELVGDRDHDFSGDSLKLSRLDAMRTAASLGEGAVWDGTQHLREMVQRLKGRTGLPAVALPPSVKADLRPYQQQGVNWLQFLREYGLAGILADDMGLGKTLQTLAHIQIEKDAGRLTQPALIIAPVSLMGNWKREAERFCPDLRCLVHHGLDRHEAADSMTDHDVVIAPYSLLHRDRQRWLALQWHLVVLDEAQNIKNANTHVAEVAGELKARYRLCLSGTPMENNLGEIWSLFHFLMPGFLGSQKRFAELFRKPIEKQGDPEAMMQLRARVTPFMLRRTKALVAHELPPKVETVMRVELSGKQADLYETIRLGMEKTVREALDAKGLAKSQITILDALLKLRQVCCDPHLVKLASAKKVTSSAKLEQLMSMLPEMLKEGRRILLFSQFTSMLSLIETELAQRNIAWVKLTGESQKRDALIERFTSGEVPLFLISLKAGGVGLNLPQADTVIHYDPWWNPAVENQATDRAHRIGQTKSVWVIKLVAQGTIEERILALQERKAALADSMYSGAVGRKQPLFSESDVQELLKPLSA